MQNKIILLMFLIYNLLPVQETILPAARYDYFPQTEGTQIEYDTFAITGTWHEDTYTLDILTRTEHTTNVVMAFEHAQCPAFSGTEMAFERPPGTYQASLYNGTMVSGNGKYYVGEAISEFGGFTFPYEPILTYLPIAGEVIDGYSTTYTSCSDATPLFTDWHWQYRTIAHYDNWGPFSDVWRTALKEFRTNHVYNYVFQKDVGIVDLWHGAVDAQGNVTGVEYWKVSP